MFSFVIPISIIEFLLFCLSVVGMSHILADGKIFSWLRNFIQKYLPSIFHEMITCYQCNGFWCGVFCSLIFFVPHLKSYLSIVGYLFAAGCAGSFLSNFAAIYMNYLENNTSFNLHDGEE